MAIKDLQGKDICAIIKECAKSGVSEFEIGDFKVKFGISTPEVVGIQLPIEGTHSLPPQTGKFDEQIPSQQMDILQKRTIEDLAQAQTLIDDPAQFESDLIDDMITEKGREYDSQERGRVREAL